MVVGHLDIAQRVVEVEEVANRAEVAKEVETKVAEVILQEAQAEGEDLGVAKEVEVDRVQIPSSANKVQVKEGLCVIVPKQR